MSATVNIDKELTEFCNDFVAEYVKKHGEVAGRAMDVFSKTHLLMIALRNTLEHPNLQPQDVQSAQAAMKSYADYMLEAYCTQLQISNDDAVTAFESAKHMIAQAMKLADNLSKQ